MPGFQRARPRPSVTNMPVVTSSPRRPVPGSAEPGFGAGGPAPFTGGGMPFPRGGPIGGDMDADDGGMTLSPHAPPVPQGPSGIGPLTPIHSPALDLGPGGPPPPVYPNITGPSGFQPLQPMASPNGAAAAAPPQGGTRRPSMMALRGLGSAPMV
jgi:hypothetical protein